MASAYDTFVVTSQYSIEEIFGDDEKTVRQSRSAVYRQRRKLCANHRARYQVASHAQYAGSCLFGDALWSGPPHFEMSTIRLLQ